MDLYQREKGSVVCHLVAGDADTNGAVAGALLGCKLGLRNIPESWVSGLKHKDWAEEKFQRFLALINADKASRKGTTESSTEHTTKVEADNIAVSSEANQTTTSCRADDTTTSTKADDTTTSS